MHLRGGEGSRVVGAIADSVEVTEAAVGAGRVLTMGGRVSGEPREGGRLVFQHEAAAIAACNGALMRARVTGPRRVAQREKART